jgi:hypothetical protein
MLVAMKLPRIVVASAAAVLLLAACGDDGVDSPSLTGEAETVRLWIQPELVDCDGGAGPQTCMLIADSEDGEPSFFYDSIAGFTFAEGTTYVIDVTVEGVEDPPADASSLSYTLVEIVEES